MKKELYFVDVVCEYTYGQRVETCLVKAKSYEEAEIKGILKMAHFLAKVNASTHTFKEVKGISSYIVSFDDDCALLI